MEEEIEKTSMKSAIIKHGIILGAIHIILFILYYIIDISLVFNFGIMFLSLAISMGYCIYAGITYRKENDIFMTYGQSFKFVYFVLLLNGLLNILVGIILVTVDPQLPLDMEEAQVEFSVGIAEWMGAPESAIDQAREDAEVQVAGSFNVLGQLKSFIAAIFLYIIGAAILGFIIRKNDPSLEV